MEIYQLHSFVTVARESHLTRAAEILNISQPAVSAHIKALEEEFAQPLFIRTPKGMKLTPGGALLCKKAEKILANVNGLTALGQELQQKPIGHLRIGLNRDSDFLRLPALYQQLKTQYSGIEIRLHHAVSGTIVRMIRKDELDCGFVLGDYSNGDLGSLVLARLKLKVVGPVEMKDRLAAASHEDLAELPWIGNPPDCPYREIMETFFFRKGLSPHTEVVADQQSAIISMIEAGAGLNFMLEEEAIEAREQGKLVIWQGGSFPIDLSFVYSGKDEQSLKTQAITTVIRTVWTHNGDNA